MKEGIIVNFDGYQGVIKTAEEQYLLLKKDIYEENTVLKENDLVIFTPDIYKIKDLDVKIARFIKKKELGEELKK